IHAGRHRPRRAGAPAAAGRRRRLQRILGQAARLHRPQAGAARRGLGRRTEAVATTINSLRQLDAWQALARHAEEIREFHLRDLFADDRDRGERLAVEAEGVYLDYSKNRVTD